MTHDERVAAAMVWVEGAMRDGFRGEESYEVRESGEIVVWINDQPEGYTRISFVLEDIRTVTRFQFAEEYLRDDPAGMDEYLGTPPD